MDFLVKLLRFDVPANMRLQSAELSCRAPMPPWLAASVVLALVAAVFYLYRLEQGTMGWLRRLTMASLRVMLLALLVILLFRPVLLTEFTGQRPRPIVLLLDNSQSMTQHDRRLTHGDK